LQPRGLSIHMRGSRSLAGFITKLIFTEFAFAALFLTTAAGNAPLPPSELTTMFPPHLGNFNRTAPASRIVARDREAFQQEDPLRATLFIAQASYASAGGNQLRLVVTKWDSDAQAYADLTTWSSYQREHGQTSVLENEIGTTSTQTTGAVAFFKGTAFVIVTPENGKDLSGSLQLARLYAATLESGEGDVPVLVKHLPNWETTQRQVIYALSSNTLNLSVPNQPILKELSFEGGTEAVVANYGQSQLVIVEFTTPQFSIDNDSRIWTKIAELKSKGESTPTAYRRVGNYSVFVFNAPDEKTANALVDQVRYEQVVQWLGDDPHLYERLQRYLTQTSAGVLAAVLKSSGLSLLLCLAAGALIGTMLFRHRRAQRAAAYSDAGGSIRLNLDELTGPVTTRPLLSAKPDEQNSTDS